MTKDEQLVKRYNSITTRITQEGNVWVVRKMQLQHINEDCDNGDYDPDYGGCKMKSHYGYRVETEYRNPSLANALKDAGYNVPAEAFA